MRYVIPVFLFLAFSLGAAQAQAKSCSSFVVIKSYDEAGKTLTVKHEKGKNLETFPTLCSLPSLSWVACSILSRYFPSSSRLCQSSILCFTWSMECGMGCSEFLISALCSA